MPTAENYTTLISGSSWWGTGVTGRPVFLTYSFNTAIQPYITSNSVLTRTFLDSFTPLTEEDRALARAALSNWADASGITFFEVPAGQGDLQFGKLNFDLSDTFRGYGGFAQFPFGPGEYDFAGDVFISSISSVFTQSVWMYMHEIGHALGLKHPRDGSINLPTEMDNRSFTVMAERPGTPSTDPLNMGLLSPLDQDAIKFLYGAAGTDGSHVASWSWDAVNYVLTQTGGANPDTIRGVHVIDIIRGGAGNDGLLGDAGNDELYGDDGDDRLFGGNGDDVLFGGNGKDTLYGEAAAGQLPGNDILRGGEGDDILYGERGIDEPGGTDQLFGDNGNDTLNGDAGNDTLIGAAGNDTLAGGAGVDIALFSGSRSVYAIAQTGIGNFTVSTIDDTDTLTGVEYAKFDDQTLRLIPGDGVIVDFDAMSASYMAAIRDFDGKELKGQGTRRIDPATGTLMDGDAWDGVSGWTLAGTADISGSGLQSHILFNSQIGRWASVTVQGDGKVHFDNHSWAGDTRIVGIYIDPLVQSGQVQAGGDHDSQRRFQNDIFIGNVQSVLHDADYDKDGGREIYFSLTDGTAFLHAYMHADGNIRYANYQSKQQVEDYLAANNFPSFLTRSAAAPPQPFAATWTDGVPLGSDAPLLATRSAWDQQAVGGSTLFATASA